MAELYTKKDETLFCRLLNGSSDLALFLLSKCSSLDLLEGSSIAAFCASDGFRVISERLGVLPASLVALLDLSTHQAHRPLVRIG